MRQAIQKSIERGVEFDLPGVDSEAITGLEIRSADTTLYEGPNNRFFASIPTVDGVLELVPTPSGTSVERADVDEAELTEVEPLEREEADVADYPTIEAVD